MDNDTARNRLLVSTRMLYDELIRQKAPVEIIDETRSLLEYTDRAGQKHFISGTCSDKSSATGLLLANSKARTAAIARRMEIVTPAQITCHDIRQVRKFMADHHRIVIKPTAGSGGAGVTTNITTTEQLESAYLYAKTYSNAVVVQQHIAGDDVRLLIVNGVFNSAVIRKPAHVVGDGVSTIKDLINNANTDISRNDDSQSSLMHINMTAAKRFLGNAIEHVPANGRHKRVVGPANVSLGGSLHEATTTVSKEMIRDSEAITKKLGLGVCGVDMMWNRTTNQHYLIEVNARPGLDIHDDPFSGTKSDCAQQYVRWLITS